MKYELKALSFGDTLGRAFNMYMDNFVVLFLLCMVINIPSIFLTVNATKLAINVYNSENVMPLVSSYMIFAVVTIVLSAVQTGLIINYIAHKYLGKEINPGDFFYKIKSSFLPLIGLSLLVSICVGFGFLMFFIPGIILYLGFILSTQVLVIEKKPIIESMKRSLDLTKGKRLRILGFWAIILAITWAVNQMSGLILRSLIQGIGLGSALWVSASISFFIASLISPFQACVFVLIYFNSRIEKEGFALEHLADQFLSVDEEETAGTGQ